MGDDNIIRQAFENLPDDAQLRGMRYALVYSFRREYALEIKGKSSYESAKMYEDWLRRMTIL